MMTTTKPLTVKEAAPLLGLSVASVYALIARRMIRHSRRGPGRGKITIELDDIEEFRKRRTVEVSEDAGGVA